MTRHRDLPYEAIRNPHLSWGYWIVLDAVGHPTWPLVDEQGERWGSLRHALWHGRLSMGGLTHALVPEEDEQCEVLLFVLAAISRTIVSTSESVHDLFAGDWRQTGHYAQWLTGHGLITPCHTLAGAQLTCEGTAILRMLAETRGRGRAGVPVAIASLHPFGALRTDPDQAAIESQIAELEAALPEPLPCRFARRVAAWTTCALLQWRAGQIGILACLIPTRTDSLFFKEALLAGASAFFFGGRLKFVKPDGTVEASKITTMLVVFGSTACQRATFAAHQKGVWVATSEGENGKPAQRGAKSSAVSVCASAPSTTLGAARPTRTTF